MYIKVKTTEAAFNEQNERTTSDEGGGPHAWGDCYWSALIRINAPRAYGDRMVSARFADDKRDNELCEDQGQRVGVQYNTPTSETRYWYDANQSAYYADYDGTRGSSGTAEFFENTKLLTDEPTGEVYRKLEYSFGARYFNHELEAPHIIGVKSAAYESFEQAFPQAGGEDDLIDLSSQFAWETASDWLDRIFNQTHVLKQAVNAYANKPLRAAKMLERSVDPRCNKFAEMVWEHAKTSALNKTLLQIEMGKARVTPNTVSWVKRFLCCSS